MPSASLIVRQLAACSRAFDAASQSRQTRLLRAASVMKLGSLAPRRAIELHETLLFIAAFPASHDIHRLAEAALTRLSKSIDASGSAFDDTGLPGATVNLEPSLDLLAWLSDQYPSDLQLNWPRGDDAATLDALVECAALPVEFDGMTKPGVPIRDWMSRADANANPTRWLVDNYRALRRHSAANARLVESLFQHAGVGVRWRIGDAKASRTCCRFPPRPVFVQTTRSGQVTRPPPIDEVINAPLSAPPPHLRGNAALRAIGMARAALASRGRETDPITYANPRETLLFRLDRGFDLLMLGMQPDRRMPIEGFLGYMLARNRIPLAYGGGWVALNRCTIGINVFDSFRGGESAHAFAQILRVYRHHLAVTRFVVDPYQIGDENEEAIESGAFWFYHRFGFRPITPKLQRLAAAQSQLIAANRKHRTPPPLLRRLARDQMVLDLSTTPDARADDIDLPSLSLAVTAWIQRRFSGDRAKAAMWSERYVRFALGLRASTMRWPAAEVAAFNRFAPLVAPIADLARWDRNAKRSLIQLMRAKGGPSEIAYLRRLQAHRQLRNAWQAFSPQYPAGGGVIHSRAHNGAPR